MEQNEAEPTHSVAETDEPVESSAPAPPAPMLGPIGVILAVATFFYFFI